MYWSTCPEGKLKQATNGNWNNSTSQIAIQLTGTLLYTVMGKETPSWKGSEEDYYMVYWGTLASELCKFCWHRSFDWTDCW
jgi:hypothetical protein